MYVEHQFCDWHAELCCTYHHQWAEMGSSITHSGWAALAAYKATALTTQFYCMFTKHWMAWPLPIWLTSLHHISRERTIESLRSASKHYLDTPCTSSKTYGDRAFMSAAPRQWDELPENIQSSKSLEVFKTNLKTHLHLQGFYRWTHMSPAGGFLVLISASFVLCCFMLVWLFEIFAQCLEQSWMFVLYKSRFIIIIIIKLCFVAGEGKCSREVPNERLAIVFILFMLLLTSLTNWGQDKMAAISQTTFWMHFLEWKCMNFDNDSIEICSQVSNWLNSSIGSDNGLVQTRRKAIIWTNDG